MPSFAGRHGANDQVDRIILGRVMVTALADLARVRAPGRGVFASGGPLFKDAIFGRDSLTAAEDLLFIRPEISREVILTLAGLQGVTEAPVGPGSSEEEPGKIHHEHRSLYVGSRRIDPASERLLQAAGPRWGADGISMTYYGSADATPLFARLVGKYCAAYGDGILAEPFTRRDGRQVTMRDSLQAAMDWITRKMDGSDLGLVEFLRRNPDGIAFQVWKDSSTSYIHRDGALANWSAPIAAIEVQAYAYDALLGAADLLHRPDWRERAAVLRQAVLDHFWMADENYFAMGLDRDPDGRTRWIESIASNGSLVLDTRLLDGLPQAQDYVTGLVSRICGSTFVTEAGIRCRSLEEVGLVGFQDYHGTWAVWMKETFAVARGLERQGMPRLARQLGSRLLNAVSAAGADLEFIYVTPEGRVMYDFEERDVRTDMPLQILGTNRPEAPQAWTVTASLALKWWCGAGRGPHGAGAAQQDQWRERLEDRVLSEMRPVGTFRRRVEIAAAYDGRADCVLDLVSGRERDQRARQTRRGTGSLPA